MPLLRLGRNNRGTPGADEDVFFIRRLIVTDVFDEGGFWNKVKNFAVTAGREVIEKALWLYFAAQAPETPVWAKTTIYGALAYFVMPLDAIPDVLPVVGYTDDLGTLAAAVGTVSMYITADVKAQAQQKLVDWFN
jgi:uncharacterized membrane protein YkvA (DUF1232 family)